MNMTDYFKNRRKYALAAGLIGVVLLGAVFFINGLTQDSYAPDIAGDEPALRILVFPERYTPFMSRVPGIRITADYDGFTGSVRYAADKGVLHDAWDVSTAMAILELPYGISAYWSPQSPQGEISQAKHSTVTVTLIDDNGQKVAEKIVTIAYDGSLFYTVMPSADIFVEVNAKLQLQKPTKIDDAVSLAIKNQGKGYYRGEYVTEGHIMLDKEERNRTVKVYTLASVGWFGFENGIFTIISGSGVIPTVMTFYKNDRDEYSLLEYQEPADGISNTDTVKKMFPLKLWSKVLDTREYYADLAAQKQRQAETYLKTIAREAAVSSDHVEKELPDIDIQASNKLFAKFPKQNNVLNNYPYWLGTRERIEYGNRYIYETSQSKTSDGYDLIIFRKLKEDGSLVEEEKYKIIGSEPQLVK